MDPPKTLISCICLVALGVVAGFQFTARLLVLRTETSGSGLLVFEGLLDENWELRQQLAALKLVLVAEQHAPRSSASNVDTAGIVLDYTLHHQGTVGCRPLCRPEQHSMLFAGRWHEAGSEQALGEQAGPPCCPDELIRPGELSDAENGACGYTSNPCSVKPPTPDYIWGSPAPCAVITWSAKQFCRVLGARTILVVGDSTFRQAFRALYNMVVHGHGGCEAHLFYAGSDTLNGWEFGWNRGAHWLQSMLQLVPDVVVMGGAAHLLMRGKLAFIDDATMREWFYNISFDVSALQKFAPAGAQTNTTLHGRPEESIARSLLSEEVAAKYAALGKRPRVFWKTAAPGGCHIGIVAYDNTTSDCFDGATLSQNKQHWNHDKFLEWDNFAIAQRTMPVIDVRMLYWRMDAHVSNFSEDPSERTSESRHHSIDCLHFNERSRALDTTFPRMLLHNIMLHAPPAALSADGELPPLPAPPEFELAGGGIGRSCGSRPWMHFGMVSAAGCAVLVRSRLPSECSHTYFLHHAAYPGTCACVDPTARCDASDPDNHPNRVSTLYRFTPSNAAK